jgi:hypothetical protein
MIAFLLLTTTPTLYDDCSFLRSLVYKLHCENISKENAWFTMTREFDCGFTNPDVHPNVQSSSLPWRYYEWYSVVHTNNTRVCLPSRSLKYNYHGEVNGGTGGELEIRSLPMLDPGPEGSQMSCGGSRCSGSGLA